MRLADLTPGDLFHVSQSGLLDRIADHASHGWARLSHLRVLDEMYQPSDISRPSCLLLSPLPAPPQDLALSVRRRYRDSSGLITSCLLLDVPFSRVLAAPPQIHLLNGTFRQKQHCYLRGAASQAMIRSLSRGITDVAQRPAVSVPLFSQLVADAGKLKVLDKLLSKLKSEGHRVLIYSQMTKMIDLLEDFLTYRQHKHIRLDGSSSLSDRRDLVSDFQSKEDIFVFLLSTRAGGLGINLTAADTVIFYDSDWNPTTDAQAMDRAHRLGQTRQVTVYRLITKGTIEERILKRARQKHTIQSIVIAGSNSAVSSKAGVAAADVVSLLLDDTEETTMAATPHPNRRKSLFT